MMLFMQVDWTLILVYYCQMELKLKINAITSLIAEQDQYCYVATFIA